MFTFPTGFLTSAQSVFNPINANSKVWIDAADTATITASGTSISQVDDKSGNNNHLVQGTASLQLETGGDLNGNNAIILPGGFSDERMDFINMDSIAGATEFSMYIVALAYASGQDRRLIHVWNGGNMTTAAAATSGDLFIQGNFGSNEYLNTSLNALSPFILKLTFGGGEMTAQLNGGAVESRSGIGTSPLPTGMNGRLGHGAATWDGLFGEILWYDAILNDDTAILAYLSNKWGITW